MNIRTRLFVFSFAFLRVLHAGAAEEGDYTYTVDNGKAIITAFTATGTVANLPETLGGYPVTSIGGSAFSGRLSLETVVVGNGVTEIGSEAFRGCTNLLNLTFGAGVKTIRYGAFAECKRLASVTLPDSLEVLENSNLASYGAFSGCTSLESVTFGTGLRTIGANAFYNCQQLTEVILPDTVTSIGNYAFQACSGLQSADLGDGLLTLGEYAFSVCTAVTNIALPRTLGVINRYAFETCSSLQSLDIPDNVTNIDWSAVAGCTGLKSVVIGDGVTAIGGSAFSGRLSLETVVIGDGVTEIGSYAFSDCTNLQNLTFGAGLKTILHGAFKNCTRLSSVTLPDSLEVLESSNLGSGGVFSGCTSLESVTFGAGLRTVGANAFYNCQQLAGIILPGTVTTIAANAFNSCTSLTGIYFKGNAPTVDSSAFSGAPNVTAYYLLGTTGWGTNLAGRPTAVWGVSAPVFTPPDGATITNSLQVSITCDAEGVSIYYTLDGSEPTTNSSLYGTPLVLTSTVTVKAKAFHSDMFESATSSASYYLWDATPVFDPADGRVFTNALDVTISSAAEEVTLRYTTDGSDVTAESDVYAAPIRLSTSATVKARAYVGETAVSEQVQAAYTLQAAASPLLYPASGTIFTNRLTVSLDCEETGACIRYTLDGNEPSETSILYTGAFQVVCTKQVKAKAFAPGFAPSATASSTYIQALEGSLDNTNLTFVTGGAAWFSQDAETYDGVDAARSGAIGDGQESWVSAEVTGPGEIAFRWKVQSEYMQDFLKFYTNQSVAAQISGWSAWETRAFTVGAVTQTLTWEYHKDISAKSGQDCGWLDEVRWYPYSLALPTFDPADGSGFEGTLDVTLACADESAVIRYTTDGSEPIESSPAYTQPVEINATTTIRAKAFTANARSLTVGATYTKLVPAATPTFDPADGATFETSLQVVLACATEGAEIRYTLDGSEPTTNSALYSTALELTQTTAVKARAFKSGMARSAVASATYTILVPAAMPTFNPADGTAFETSLQVSLASATEGAEIRYTLDGSEPTTNSALYSTALELTQTTAVKARAFKSGMARSAVASATYTRLQRVTRIEPATLSFGNVQVRNSATNSVLIYNDGNTNLTVSGVSCPSGFSAMPTAFTVGGGTSFMVAVVFTPGVANAYSGTVAVVSDATSGESSFTVTGTGTAPVVRVWYVNASMPDDAGDGLSWSTAKRTIQAAVDASVAGDTVIVTNGLYEPISVNNVAITIRSVNGADVTIIDADRNTRCALLGDSENENVQTNTVLEGFTLQNGDITGYGDGGGAWRGTLRGCVLRQNWGDYGGGAFGSVLYGCTLAFNHAAYSGGGASGCMLEACRLTANTAEHYGGGAENSELHSCVVSGNESYLNGGGASDCTLVGCTVVGNMSDDGGGISGGTTANSIIWANEVYSGSATNYDGAAVISYSCSLPLPDGAGNIDGEPFFLNVADGDYRLREGSPGVDTGNSALAVGESDFMGNARVQSTAVDMGACEGAVSGYLVRVNVVGHGTVTPAGAQVVSEGGSLTVEAAQGPGPFLNYLTNGVLASTETTFTWQGIDADGEVTAVFGPAVFYVDAAMSDDAMDGCSWATAKQSIQAAIDAAWHGDAIWVTNGLYAAIDTQGKRIAIRSVNGATETVIDGAATERCAKLGDGTPEGHAALTGFTLRNGYTYETGAGALYGQLVDCVLTGNTAESSGGGASQATLSGCVLEDNMSSRNGGGATVCLMTNCVVRGNYTYSNGGGTYLGRCTACVLTNNTTDGRGGGAYYGTFEKCLIAGNQCMDDGGGAYQATLADCEIAGNTSGYRGGGACYSTLARCIVSGNTSVEGGGTYSGSLSDCLVKGNRASEAGGTRNGTLINVTVTGNIVDLSGGGVSGGTQVNCIIWDNWVEDWLEGFVSNNYDAETTLNMTYTCTSPAHGGAGNISADPVFVNVASGNYSLAAGSPCLDAGNSAAVQSANDLAGNTRIQGAAVDLGAYERPEDAAVSTPTFNPVDGTTFEASLQVNLSCATEGAEIRYTLDGSAPTTNSLRYSTALELTETTTVKARAFKSGMINSAIASATYTRLIPVATPTFNPTDGTSFEGMVLVELFCATEGAEIRYTLDNTEPTAESAFYTAAIELSETMTVKARAFKSGMAVSVAASATYTREAPSGSWSDLGVYDTDWYEPTRSVFSISNAQQLAGLAVLVNAGNSFMGKEVMLTSDVSLTGRTWIAIGTASSPFYGQFHGGGKTIDSVTVFQPGSDNQGLFGSIALNGVIQDVTLKNASVVGRNCVGGVAGRIYHGTVKNCMCFGNVSGHGQNAGGIVGRNLYGSVMNCLSAGTVVGYEYTGGIVGDCFDDDGILNCVSVSALFDMFGGDYGPGGIVGYDGSVACCYWMKDGTSGHDWNIRPLALGYYGSYSFTTPPGTLSDVHEIYETDSLLDALNAWVEVNQELKGPLLIWTTEGSESGYPILAMNSSHVATTPTFDPADGTTFETSIQVSLACATEGAEIRYTLDGSDPTTNSAPYSTALELAQTTTVKARAFKAGMAGSAVASATYTKLAPVATPAFDPADGTTFETSIQVTLACATGGAEIRYTLDGSEPTTNSAPYSTPLELAQTTTVKARAFKAGMAGSAVASATYTKLDLAATPAFDPADGTSFETTLAVSLTCATSGAEIRYTLDGSEPTTNSALYATALELTQTTTVKARAFKAGMAGSAVASATYTKLAPVATPTFDPADGATFETSLQVALSCTTGGAEIRYTLDGSEPTTNSVLYATALELTQTTTVKARAFKSGMTGSAVASATYVRQTRIIRIVPLSLDFGNVEVGQCATNTVQTINDGNTNLTVTSVSYPSEISVSPITFIVGRGQSNTITVIFTPVAEGSYSGRVTVVSDATSGDTGFSVTGRGVIMTTGVSQIVLTTNSVIGGSGAWDVQTYTATFYGAHHVVDNQTGPVSESAPGNFWIGRENTYQYVPYLNEYFILDLGAKYLINRLELFNTHNQVWNDRATRDFVVYAANDVVYTGLANGYTLASTNQILNGSLAFQPFANDPIEAETFTSASGLATGTAYRYLMFKAVNTFTPVGYGGFRSVGLNEIRIYGLLPSSQTATQTTPIPVPYAWLDAYQLTAGCDYEAAALADTDGDGRKAWEEYVAGTCPTSGTSLFLAIIAVSNGVPHVSWVPNMGAERRYTVEGKAALTNLEWYSPTNAASRFFRVKVEMP